MSALDNYFAMEPLLLARLREQLGVSVEQIGGAAEFYQAAENGGPFPAVFAVLVDEEVTNAGHSGRVLHPVQVWRVAVVDSPAQCADSGCADYARAGRLLVRIYNALAGWRASSDFQVMQRTGKGLFDYPPGLVVASMDFRVGIPRALGELA